SSIISTSAWRCSSAYCSSTCTRAALRERSRLHGSPQEPLAPHAPRLCLAGPAPRATLRGEPATAGGVSGGGRGRARRAAAAAAVVGAGAARLGDGARGGAAPQRAPGGR